MTILPEDLLICAWSSKPQGGFSLSPPTGIKIVHRPTGIEVTCDTERSPFRNRAIAMESLRYQLAINSQRSSAMSDTKAADIKIIENMEPWEVMKAASEGKPVAMKNSDGSYREHLQPRLIPLGQFIVGNVAIIDRPHINWEEFDWDLFGRYDGLKITHSDGQPGRLVSSDVHPQGATLRESPWYPWDGDKVPVPGNCEVEVEYIAINGSNHSERRRTILAAADVGWAGNEQNQDGVVIAFRLTGRML